MNLFSMLLCDGSFFIDKMIFKNKVMGGITKRLIFELLDPRYASLYTSVIIIYK